MKNDNDLVFAFDLGSGSIGVCVRKGREILYLDSLLIDNDYASVTDASKRRRQIRTRVAHKKREEWWIQEAKKAGIEVLSTAQPTKENPNLKPDIRMLREFPSANSDDKTVYSSHLLRIALLQNVKLEGWQIFKAVWSAMQRRGYDSDVPWKHDAGRKETDEKENKKAVNKYDERLAKFFVDKKEYYYPCYYEARKQRIWAEEDPNNLKGKLKENPEPSRNKDKSAVPSRELVSKELKALLVNAAEQFPKLKGREDYIIYGPSEEPYASFRNPKYFEHRGTEWDWHGLLGQKVPRFDNRIISKCKLIPRLNVCKADKVLNKEVTFLLTLKDMRYTLGQISSKSLSHEEIKYLFEKYKNNLRTDEQKKEKLITAKNWKEYIQSKDGKINPNQKEIPQRKLSGRSRFCKPALNILHGLILSGKKPHDYYKELVDQSKNVNPSKGLVKDDYKFLLAMPNDWNSISIQDTREDDKKLTREQSLEKIDKIIGSISNRIVRHRLLILKSELEKLDKRFGKPEKIIFEIAREDFIGEKKKTEYKSFQNDNKKEITNARKLLENKKICINDMNILRARLYERQKSIDIYDTSENRNIVISKLDQYEIDHIVPRRKGGSDSMVNYILTKREFNQDKEGSTPYEWFHKKRAGDWDSYLKNVDEIFCKDKNNKNKNKVNLLISDKAIELNSRKTDLQATSYIEKDAQYLSSLYFGWGLNTKDDKKKILFYTGAETASVRKNLELNRILFADPDLTDEEYKKTKQSDDFKDKNRKNERHHALDALVLSVLPEIKLNFKKVEEKPDFFNKEFCEKEINKVYPKTIKQVTPKLRETIYGLRWRLEKDEKTNKVEKKYYFVSRYKSFIDNFKLLKSAKKGKIFDLKIKEKLNEENLTQEKWEEFLKDYKDDYKGIKKIAIIDYPPKAFKKSEVFNSDDAINNVIGEYGDKGAIKGQWIKRKKSHQGQIVYKDEKDKWIVVPIYAFESVYLKRKEYTDKYKEKVKFFKSGQLVEIKENYKNKKGKDIEKGVYKLRTLRINGDCEIENLNNQKTLKKKIGIFLEQCGMIPYEKQ